MAAAKDFLLLDNETVFSNGDFVIDYSDSQHIEDIVSENIGAYKQFPLCGVGIINYLNSSGAQQALRNEINTQLAIDGYSVNDVFFATNDTSSLSIDAVRN